MCYNKERRVNLRSNMQTGRNATFQDDALVYGKAPNPFIKEYLELLAPLESVLCIGVKESESAIFLADKGLRVDALDTSDSALIRLRKHARENYVAINVRHTFLTYWHPNTLYGAVICSYIHLPKNQQKMLFTKSFTSLKEGGIFMAELLSESQTTFQNRGPKNIGFLYDFNDISTILKSLPCHLLKLAQEVILLNEGEKHAERASVIRVIARKVTSAH